MRSLNDEILASVDAEWDDVFVGRPRPYLSQFDRSLRHRATEVLRDAFGDKDPIVLKDPRINVLAAFWDGALKTAGFYPYYLIMVRHPLEVAASLLARDQMPLEHGMLLWLDYMIAAERDTRGAPRVFVAYDDLFGNWQGVLDRVEQAWDHPLPRRTAVAAAEIRCFIKPDLRHHTFSRDVADGESLAPTPTLAVYEWFKIGCHRQPLAEYEVLDRGSQWLESLRDQLEPMITYKKLQLLEARRQLDEYVQHSRALEDVREVLQSELGHLRGALDDSTKKITETQAAMDTRSAELEQVHKVLQTELGQTQEAYKVCVIELTEIRAAMDIQSTELQQMRADGEARSVELEQVRAASAAYVNKSNAEKETSAGRELALNEKLKAAHAERAAQLTKTDRLEAQCSELSGLLETERRSLREVRAAQHQAIESIRETLEGQLLARDLAPANFEDELRTLEGRYHALSDEMRRVQAVAETALVRRRKLEVELTTAHRTNDAKRIDYEHAIAELREATAKVHKSLEAEREAVLAEKRRREQAEGQAQVLESDLFRMQRDYKIIQQENDALKSERAKILNSTTWRLAAVPRRILGGFRRS